MDYVVVGGYNEEGNADPSMITFVYRTGFKDRKNGDHYKPARLNAAEKKSASSCDSATEACQRDDTHLKESSGLYYDLQLLTKDKCKILQPSSTYGTRGDGCVTAKGELVKVLEFTHFYEHFTFDKTDWSDRGKHLKKYIRVIVAVELVTVGAKIAPRS